jgi:hypothetical protein
LLALKNQQNFIMKTSFKLGNVYLDVVFAFGSIYFGTIAVVLAKILQIAPQPKQLDQDLSMSVYQVFQLVNKEA